MFAENWWREPEELDEYQREVAALPLDGAYLISGQPGSGKTNLLILRGRFLSLAGSTDLKVVTWTRLIREFIATGNSKHELSDDQLQTFLAWGVEALRVIGKEVELPENDFLKMIEELVKLLQADRSELRKYQGFLLDEVQDYSAEMIGLFASLSKRLFFVGDDNQRIYRNVGGIKAVRDLVNKEVKLPFHYRNGIRICLVAENLLGDSSLVNTSRYDETRYPSSVSLEKFESVEKQVDSLVTSIKLQMRAYPGQLIGVLVPFRDERREVIERLRGSEIGKFCQYQVRQEQYSTFDPEKPVVVCSVHGAKGLEFRAVHLVALEGFSSLGGNRKALAYMAVTRAKTSLKGYYTGSVEHMIAAAFKAGLDSKENPPVLEDLF